MTNQQLFLTKMYQYLGEAVPHVEHIMEDGNIHREYPYELFASSPIAKAAARAFDDLTTIAG